MVLLGFGVPEQLGIFCLPLCTHCLCFPSLPSPLGPISVTLGTSSGSATGHQQRITGIRTLVPAPLVWGLLCLQRKVTAPDRHPLSRSLPGPWGLRVGAALLGTGPGVLPSPCIFRHLHHSFVPS